MNSSPELLIYTSLQVTVSVTTVEQNKFSVLLLLAIVDNSFAVYSNVCNANSSTLSSGLIKILQSFSVAVDSTLGK